MGNSTQKNEPSNNYNKNNSVSIGIGRNVANSNAANVNQSQSQNINKRDYVQEKINQNRKPGQPTPQRYSSLNKKLYKKKKLKPTSYNNKFEYSYNGRPSNSMNNKETCQGYNSGPSIVQINKTMTYDYLTKNAVNYNISTDVPCVVPYDNHNCSEKETVIYNPIGNIEISQSKKFAKNPIFDKNNMKKPNSSCDIDGRLRKSTPGYNNASNAAAQREFSKSKKANNTHTHYQTHNNFINDNNNTTTIPIYNCINDNIIKNNEPNSKKIQNQLHFNSNYRKNMNIFNLDRFK